LLLLVSRSLGNTNSPFNEVPPLSLGLRGQGSGCRRYPLIGVISRADDWRCFILFFSPVTPPLAMHISKFASPMTYPLLFLFGVFQSNSCLSNCPIFEHIVTCLSPPPPLENPFVSDRLVPRLPPPNTPVSMIELVSCSWDFPLHPSFLPFLLCPQRIPPSFDNGLLVSFLARHAALGLPLPSRSFDP